MNTEDLESALNNVKKETKKNAVSKEEEIGFHKGALNTLIAERVELLKMVGNVEGIAGAHAKRLKELGVNVNEK